MRVLVTGAAGMLGRDVVEVARGAGHDVAGLSRVELDVVDVAAVERAVADLRPEAVINCAAFTDVDAAEERYDEALAVNGAGAGNVAAAADAVGAPVVHVSTDYVFDGAKPAPYTESDEPDPRSGYGRSKLEGELAVAAANPRHAIVRSSWLFGVGGRNFVATMLARGAELGEVSVVTDQVGCPTFTGHLAPALLALAERGATGVLHVAGSGHCSWHDFAVEIFRQAGVDCRVDAATTAEMTRPAPRPPYSVMASERAEAPRLPDWQQGLEAYVAERAPARASA
jgi:dTDP-4-dehydrorhamnose reductase